MIMNYYTDQGFLDHDKKYFFVHIETRISERYLSSIKIYFGVDNY